MCRTQFGQYQASSAYNTKGIDMHVCTSFRSVTSFSASERVLIVAGRNWPTLNGRDKGEGRRINA